MGPEFPANKQEPDLALATFILGLLYKLEPFAAGPDELS